MHDRAPNTIIYHNFTICPVFLKGFFTMTDTITEAIDTAPALPTEEKTTATETAATWTCPDFKVSGVFSSHMVLQREKPIKVWGFSTPPAPAWRARSWGRPSPPPWARTTVLR